MSIDPSTFHMFEDSQLMFTYMNRSQNLRWTHVTASLVIIADQEQSKNFSQWLKAPPNIVETLSSAQKIESESEAMEKKMKVNNDVDAQTRWRWIDDGARMQSGIIEWRRVALEMILDQVNSYRSLRKILSTHRGIHAQISPTTSSLNFCFVSRASIFENYTISSSKGRIVRWTIGDAEKSFLWFSFQFLRQFFAAGIVIIVQSRLMASWCR